MTSTIVRFGLALAALAAPHAVQAARPGELWESTTQMNMPGLPAGMGAQKVTLCKDPKEAVPQDPKRQQCQVLEQKQSGSRVTVRMRCPDGEMTMDFTYNAARTEYKGTMEMKSRNGDMTMNVAGRKLGACDLDNPQDTRAQAQAKGEQMKRDIAASQKQSEEDAIRKCDAALETMDHGTFQGASPESCKPGSQLGDSMSRALGKGWGHCCANSAEYCKRYQTWDGFNKTRNDRKGAAQYCGLSYDKVKAPLCQRAVKSESFDFLMSYCPAESKTLAARICTGRNFTAEGGQIASFCGRHLASKDFDDNESAGKPQRAARPAAQKAAEPQPASTPAPAPAANPAEAVNQGINKLKGLFGR